MFGVFCRLVDLGLKLAGIFRAVYSTKDTLQLKSS